MSSRSTKVEAPGRMMRVESLDPLTKQASQHNKSPRAQPKSTEVKVVELRRKGKQPTKHTFSSCRQSSPELASTTERQTFMLQECPNAANQLTPPRSAVSKLDLSKLSRGTPTMKVTELRQVVNMLYNNLICIANSYSLIAKKEAMQERRLSATPKHKDSLKAMKGSLRETIKSVTSKSFSQLVTAVMRDDSLDNLETERTFDCVSEKSSALHDLLLDYDATTQQTLRLIEAKLHGIEQRFSSNSVISRLHQAVKQLQRQLNATQRRLEQCSHEKDQLVEKSTADREKYEVRLENMVQVLNTYKAINQDNVLLLQEKDRLLSQVKQGFSIEVSNRSSIGPTKHLQICRLAPLTLETRPTLLSVSVQDTVECSPYHKYLTPGRDWSESFLNELKLIPSGISLFQGSGVFSFEQHSLKEKQLNFEVSASDSGRFTTKLRELEVKNCELQEKLESKRHKNEFNQQLIALLKEEVKDLQGKLKQADQWKVAIASFLTSLPALKPELNKMKLNLAEFVGIPRELIARPLSKGFWAQLTKR